MRINFSACWALKQTTRIPHFPWSDKHLKVTGEENNNRYFTPVYSRDNDGHSSNLQTWKRCALHLKAHLKTMMDCKNKLTLSFSDGYSASPPVVHYAAFSTTANAQFRLQICQPRCHGSQWSDRNVPITKDVSVLFSRGRTSFSNPS